MKFFRRIQNEGVRRIFCCMACVCLALHIFLLLKMISDRSDSMWKMYYTLKDTAYEIDTPYDIISNIELMQSIIFLLISWSTITASLYGVFLTVQWIYSGFKKA